MERVPASSSSTLITIALSPSPCEMFVLEELEQASVVLAD